MTDKLFATGASIDITPQEKTPLGANGSFDNAPYHQIDDPLEINGVLLRQGSTNVVFLSTDTLYVTDEIKKEVLNTINKNFNLKSDQLFLGSSHTHYAPHLDEDKPKLGKVVSSYKKLFIKKCIIIINELFQKKGKEADLIYQTNPANLAINRQGKAWSLIGLRKRRIIFPNPEGPIDNNIYSLSIKTNKKLLGVIWCFACHPVCYPDIMNVTSHFPGRLRKALRDQLGDARLPVVFYQGFSGNIRPKSFEKTESFKSKMLLKLNGHPRFANFSFEKYRDWIGQLTDCFLNTIWGNDGMLIEPKIKSTIYEIPLSEVLNTSTKRNLPISFHSIFLGNQHLILGISGEVVSEYVFLLKKVFSQLIIIPVGCLSGTFGYLPTSAMIGEGGYESKGFLKYFSLDGAFKSNIEEVFIESSKRVLT